MFACMYVKFGETPDFCGILCCLVSKDLSALTVLVAMAQQQ
jgi:hypothetical protein